MNLENYLNKGKVYVWTETYAVVKSKKMYNGAFANIIDKNEITVIIDQNLIDKKDIIEVEENWKILTFDMVLPFGLVGFMAKISGVLAEEKIPIFVISAFSTDHVLVKEKDLLKAIKKLKSLGCIFEKK
jgi:hypothetical protein